MKFVMFFPHPVLWMALVSGPTFKVREMTNFDCSQNTPLDVLSASMDRIGVSWPHGLI